MAGKTFNYWGWHVNIRMVAFGLTYFAEATKKGRVLTVDTETLEEARVAIKTKIEQRENSFRKARP